MLISTNSKRRINTINQEQIDVLEHVKYQLKTSIYNHFESYEHTEFKDGQEVVSQINREKHLELIMKWAVQELEKNFNINEENGKMNKKIETVKINDLKVDYSYRSLDNPNADGIIENFKRLAIGYITVSAREDGLYIIDGIRRVEALKHLGYVECPAELLHGLTVEDEARIFVNTNKFHDEYDEEYEVYPDVEVEEME